MPLVLVGLAVAWLVMLLFGGLELDRALATILYAGADPRIARAAHVLTMLGGLKVLGPLTAAGTLWLCWQRRFRSAIALLAVTLGGRALVEVQKLEIARIRPEANPHLVEVKSLSFPSSHAANATIVYLALALLLTATFPRRAIALWAAAWLAIAIGASRVALGVHWPSDVIAGWAFGLAWTLLMLRLTGHDLGDGTPRPLRHSAPQQGDSQCPTPTTATTGAPTAPKPPARPTTAT